MRQETSLFARPKRYAGMIILAVAVFIGLCSIFFIKFYNSRKAYQEYVSMIPAPADVSAMDFYLTSDGSLVFTADNMYSFMILDENSQIGTLHSHTVGGNTINAVFLPMVSEPVNALILTALEQGIDIRNIYVPEGTKTDFLDAVTAKSGKAKTIICSGGEYQLFKDTMAYVLNGKDSLSICVTHGANTFLYSHDKAVGTLFNKQEATVCILPYDVFLKSKISSVYSFFTESEISHDKLLSKTDYYMANINNANIYCSSTGNEVSFDVYLTATGRLLEN